MPRDPMTLKEALDILGLSGDIQLEDVKKKYRQMSLQNHPDKAKSMGKDPAEMMQKQKKINEAYEYLCRNFDSAKRVASQKQEKKSGRPSDPDWFKDFVSNAYSGVNDSTTGSWGAETNGYRTTTKSNLDQVKEKAESLELPITLIEKMGRFYITHISGIKVREILIGLDVPTANARLKKMAKERL